MLLIGSFEQSLTDMFVLGIPLLEKMVRPILVYFFLLLLLRLFGKRELAQLNPFDFVVLLCLSNTVQNSMIGDDNTVIGGLIGAFTLVAINFVMVKTVRKHRRLDNLIEGMPTYLIRNGSVCEEGLKAEMITESELLMVVRRQGFNSLDEIDECILEPTGTFDISAKDPRLEDQRQDELIEQLTSLRDEIQQLRQDLAVARPA